MLSKSTEWISPIRVEIDTSLIFESYLTARQSIYFLAKKSWWLILSKNWTLYLLFLIFKLHCLQRNCQDFLRQSLNQRLCFCTRWFHFHVFFFHRLLENLITLNCQKFCICMILFCSGINFFWSHRLHFFTKATLKVLKNLKCETLLFITLSRKLGWLKIPKFAYASGARDSNSFLHNYRLEFFHQGVSGRFKL